MRKLFFAVLLAPFVFSACTKIETTNIGSGLIPPIDGVTVKDTFFDVITNTYLDDNISRVYKSDDHVIGHISNDPLFGKTTASLFLELKPTQYPFAFSGIKDSIAVDSAVLILSYQGTYGDTMAPQTWRVHEINQSNKLKFDSAYDVGTGSLNYSNAILGEKSNFDIRSLDDSVKNRYEQARNQIRITLNNSFANRLLKNYDSLGAYQSDSLFKNNFAGFAIVPNQTGNALIMVNLLDTNTKLSLYYSTRVDGSTKRDTTVTSFRFNTSGGSLTSGSANFIRRDRAGVQVSNFINTGRNDSLLFLSTSPGTFGVVKIPNLSSFRNSLIFRAELVAIQASDNVMLDDYLAPPRYLLLSAYDSANKRKINVPNDYEITQGGSNLQSFGGIFTKKNIAGVGNVGTYTFTLTRYVQGIVSRNDSSYTLRLTAPSNDSLFYKSPYPFVSTPAPAYISPTNANIIANGRVRLYGGTGPAQLRLRLRLIYSEL